RTRADFPEPEKVPFDPTQAESIESIRPVAPTQIDPDLLDRGIWEIQEGMKFDTGVGGASTQILLSPGADQLNRLLEEAVPESMTVPLEETSPPPAEPVLEPTSSLKESIDDPSTSTPLVPSS